MLKKLKNTVLVGVITLVAITSAVLTPATFVVAKKANKCETIRPVLTSYVEDRMATDNIIVPNNPACTTISVKNIKDPGNPGDHCATFIVAFLTHDGGDPIYTEPVEACSKGPHGQEVILAANIPDGTNYFLLYDPDYLEQSLKFQVTH